MISHTSIIVSVTCTVRSLSSLSFFEETMSKIQTSAKMKVQSGMLEECFVSKRTDHGTC